MKRFVSFLAVILLFAFVTGCGVKAIPPDPTNPIKRLAVLPMQNDTTDVNGPNYVRKIMVEHLAKHNYKVIPVEETDKLLRDRIGLTLGGQLMNVPPEKFKEVLDVEGVLFGILMDFKETSVGVYNVRKVRADFKLVRTDTGETFWENGLGVKCEQETSGLAGTGVAIAAGVQDAKDEEVPWVSISDNSLIGDQGAVNNLGINLGKKLLAKATKTFLKRETNEMAARVLSNIRSGPGAGEEE